MSRVSSIIKITIYSVIILVLILIGITITFIYDSEYVLIQTLETEMELKIPDDYTILEGKGSFFNPPIEYVFLFSDNGFSLLEKIIKESPHFNDSTFFINYFTNSLDESKAFENIKGQWIEDDTSYQYFPMNSELDNIIVLHKRKRTLHASY
jgi:hypothetical protein